MCGYWINAAQDGSASHLTVTLMFILSNFQVFLAYDFLDLSYRLPNLPYILLSVRLGGASLTYGGFERKAFSMHVGVDMS